MNGKQEYDLGYQKRIDKVLRENNPILKDYYGYIGTNKSMSTKFMYISYVAKFLKDRNKNINDLKMIDFSNYITNIFESKTSSYAISVYAALRLFGEFLYAAEILDKDPMQFVKRPKFKESKKTKEKREIGYLTDEEVEILKKNIKEGVGSHKAIKRQQTYRNRDMLIVLLFLVTGMRKSALSKIDVEDINLDTLEINVTDKGDKINNYVLPEQIKPYIDAWLIDREKILNGINEPALIISEQKKRMSTSGIGTVIEKYSYNIEGKHITPHKLRATYGIKVYTETHDIYYTQQCMGHSSPSTTELYIRGEVNPRDKAANIVSSFI